MCPALASQGDSVPAGDDGPFADTVTLEQKISSIGGSSGKVSLWMQWMLPKVTVKLFSPDTTAKKTGTESLVLYSLPLCNVCVKSNVFIYICFYILINLRCQKKSFKTLYISSNVKKVLCPFCSISFSGINSSLFSHSNIVHLGRRQLERMR